jgi:hypothetical protein
VRGFKDLFPYAPLSPLESFRAAIEGFIPDIIVPICDRSVQHLHQLHAQCATQGELGRQIGGLIERSLGPADSFSIVSSRYDLLMMAKEAGIRVPETVRVDSVDDLRRWENRPPVFLKADGSSCGLGVRRAGTLSSGERALRQLTCGISAFGLVSQLLLYRDRARTISAWSDPQPGIIAQTIVIGRPANCSVVCWRGQLLAGIAVEVVQADGPCEPAVVVQVIESSEMLDAAKQIAHRLQLTGFFGLDFILEEDSGKTHLIEMNPRCTPPCFLNLGEGRDLLAAFWAKLTEQEMPQRMTATQKTRIAYFPTAVLRGSVTISGSESLYLDLPSGQPELVQELLHPWSEMSLAGRALNQLRRNMPLKRQLRQMLSAFNATKLANADQ